MGFFNALRNVPWKQYQGTQWRLNFIRSGLNFNAATQIFNYIKARSNDWAFLLPKFGNHILWVCRLTEHALCKRLDVLGNFS